MWTSMQSSVGTSPLLLSASSTGRTQACVKHSRPNIVGMQPLPYNIGKGKLRTAAFQSSSPRIICNAALNVKCSAAGATATQTVTRNARTITLDKVKSPMLDNNGPGLPPRDDDGNGGNGGGGGGNFSGGLALLGILGVLDILKDIESEFQRKDRRFDQA
ncbi:uncharacterized protein [Cicer arietinum]|uniref:Protein YELLOW LEAF 1, choloroplastic-like n=1 Tax=Cicer arietinum TaxID=3827 RepID=A0A1S2XI99_CICAR|nr:protein YELLOW LEAF 1, choloroplastic-like [Cicer arietinum]XP_027187693.1 protein YELLOW LEAF 1, choloroplastic-like [Cicer arietinum]